VAALTGVTLFGGLSIVAAGVAAAATTPGVTATLSAGATATTIAGTVTGGAGGSLTLNVTGTPVSGDRITLTLACPSTGTAVFDVVTDTATADFGAATLGTNAAGCSTATFTSTGTVANPTLVLSPLTFTTHDVTSQALSLSGTYATLGLAASSFSVPTVASVSWFNVPSNSPAVMLPTTGTTAVSPISITEPANQPGGNLAVGDTVTLTLPSTDTWGSATTLSAVGATATLSGQSTNVLTITVNTLSSAGGSVLFTVSNASVTTTGASLGVQTLTTNSTLGSVAVGSIGSILGTATTIYGANGTADGTVAAEFENAYPASAGGSATVVLATDAPSTNGSDALAASYLEGTLHTGLLITPSTTLGPDARQALQLEGVKTVYVVGGPLAVSPAVIAQIKALPAYNAGGLTVTGSNVAVIGPIYGADGTAAGTAAAIASYFGSAYGAAAFPGAYSAAGGVYNDTTGNASASGPTSAVPTAIVVASTDWQDAMSIAPEAFNRRFPVILTGPSTDTTLGADAAATLTALGVKQVIIIGGQFAVQNSVEAQIAALNGGISVLRIAGIDATDTAAQIANFALASGTAGLGWTAGNHSVLASHVDYWTDALGAAALGGGANASYGTQPIILVESPLVIGQYTTAELTKLAAAGVTNLTVLGGPLAMPSSTVQTLLAGL
jgi:putative cell wall-binding protein